MGRKQKVKICIPLCKYEGIPYDWKYLSGELKDGLDDYINRKFPKGLLKMIRIKERSGLINARLTGWRNSTGEVIIFLDSHMEVNINW